MEIIRLNKPILTELSDEDITLMHLAFYEYKARLKRMKAFGKDKVRKRMRHLNKMINLVDLLI